MTGQEVGVLTAREYSFATPADLGGQGNYRRFCRSAGLHAISGGWGLLHCTGQDGRHVTAITDDVAYQRMLVEANTHPEGLAGIEIRPDKYRATRPGWPDEWGDR